MASQFTPTTTEHALVNQIFAQADTQKIGILTGDVAVRVFGGAKLAPAVLGEIWNIADEDNNGFLTRKGVTVAVRLIGWAQKGEKISRALLSKPGPLANIDGVHAPLIPQGTGISIPKSPPPGLPLLTPQDKAKFARLFQGCGPVNGLLNGDKARGTFVKSKLPVDKLSRIWSLADTQDRGALDLTDFTIAMYLIQASMSNQLSFIPTSLPPGLYEQASGTSIAAHTTGSSAHLNSPATTSFSAPLKQPSVQTNFTGQSNLAPALPSRRSAPLAQTPAAPLFPGLPFQAAAHWDVTPVQKASADHLFDTLDPHKRGYIEGDVAVPFMLQSKLPEDVLAQVWDLSDINNDGRLTRDGFAIAMHLIQGKISGKEIPAALPTTLMPPSMRANGPTSPFTATSPTHPSEPIHDLLWDDSPPTSTVNTQPQHNALQPHATGPVPSAITPPLSYHPTQAPEDPFSSATHGSFHRDLLGDDDETHSHAPLHDQSAEIGNLQNQVNSTNKSLQDAKAERGALEATLANQAAQLSALQTQLASAKASFETETNLLNTLRERHANQNAEIQKVREELIRSESDLSGIRVEKAEIEGAFLRDKEEVRDLNRRMAEATIQITTVKQEVEKAKKDAKQQKGLLAIARKQLAAKESEKAKVDLELEEAEEDVINAARERIEAEAEVEKTVASPQPLPVPVRTKSPADSLAFAAALPLPVTPDITGASPLGPGVKSNNPFERLVTSSGTSTPRSQSSFTTPPPPIPSLTPADVVVTMFDDPFGISQPFDSAPKAVSDKEGAMDAGVTTPKAKPMLEEFGEIMSSPSDEIFSTPPNGNTPTNFGGEGTPHIHSLGSATTHFPALDDIPSGGQEHETDLSANLHELDDDDTDSDTDSDDESQERTSQDREARPFERSSIKNTPAPFQVAVSLEDIFGVANVPVVAPSAPVTAPQPDNVPPPQNGSAAFDAFGVPLAKPTAPLEDSQDSGFTFINAPTNVASKDSSGISSFDEAFGKSSSTAPSQTVSNFSFESAFEDNFDFGGSGAATEQLPSKPSFDIPPATSNTPTIQAVVTATDKTPNISSLPVNSGSTDAPTALPARVSSDDTFSSGPPAVQPITPPTEKAEANQVVMGSGISFEEAFGGVDTSQALKLDNSFTSRTSAAVTNPGSPPDATKQFPTVSPTTSPRGPASPHTNASIRSGSPQPRATSPLPRVASPKAQRPSMSSSSTKDAAHEKPPPPPRHSKISLRLPFGKKKKQETMPPIPASRVAGPGQPGATTPAVDDDVEPVRQLAAMGFGRSQAVTALEAHDYDVQKALNSLLGS